jgi:leucine dehydrogenase
MAVSTTRDAPRAASLEDSGHELLIVRHGRRTGIQTIVAVHSTALGPALGGCRLWRYPSLPAAIDDALRLSRAMTLKAAAAGLSLGGGKAVIRLPEGVEAAGPFRRELLHDFADTVNLLGGSYITAEDVGTTAEDMSTLARYSRHVVGSAERGGSGDPGDFTAAGVQAAMRACCERCFGSPELAGRSVAIVGLGHVGAPLARRLRRDGASLIASDIDSAKMSIAAELGARWLEPEQALRADVDVLAPCALGGVLDDALVGELGCRIVCGSANNQLSSDRVAEHLAARGILYAPDFIVNSGGLINVALELTGYDRELAMHRVRDIQGVLARVLARAEQASVTPLDAAMAAARERLVGAADHDRR